MTTALRSLLQPEHHRHRRHVRTGPRFVVAAVVGLLVLLGLSTATGLWTTPVGAADNGDGVRLYCGAGLLPETPNSRSSWKGGVVVDFSRTEPCADAVPSSALVILRAAVVGGGQRWSLTALGWTYAVLMALVAAGAAWAASRAALSRVTILAPALVPLIKTDFSRFFLSTYSEPAGLLGAVTLLCGLGVVLVTHRDERAERGSGLALLAVGGLVAGTAKPGYIPLTALAALVCAATALSVRKARPRWTDRVAGPLTAAALLVTAAGPVGDAIDYQKRRYGGINPHNLVYTVVLVEVPGSAGRMGLPDDAGRLAGEAYFPYGPRGKPGADLIKARPDAVQRRALGVLLSEPTSLGRAVGVAMQATRSPALGYLPSQPYTSEPPPGEGFPPVGEQGADAASLRGWLDAMPRPWWPSVLAITGLALGVIALRWRHPLGRALAGTAGATAAGALGVAALAVLGDGYFEIAKHVWLAAYLLDVTLLACLGAACTALLVAAHRRARQAPQHD